MVLPAHTSLAEQAIIIDGKANTLTVNGGELYRVDAGGEENIVEYAELSPVKEVKGVGYWIGINPEFEKQREGMSYRETGIAPETIAPYMGLAGGVYFFDEGGKFIKFLEAGEADMNDVIFSPGGKYVVLDRGTYVDRHYRIFHFETGEPMEEFYGMGLTWLDPDRAAFTFIDESEGNRSENSDITGWFSVVVYDMECDKFKTVKYATSTEDYQLIDLDHDARELVIQKFSVKNARDWGDEGKRRIEVMRVSIPALECE